MRQLHSLCLSIPFCPANLLGFHPDHLPLHTSFANFIQTQLSQSSPLNTFSLSSYTSLVSQCSLSPWTHFLIFLALNFCIIYSALILSCLVRYTYHLSTHCIQLLCFYTMANSHFHTIKCTEAHYGQIHFFAQTC